MKCHYILFKRIEPWNISLLLLSLVFSSSLEAQKKSYLLMVGLEDIDYAAYQKKGKHYDPAATIGVVNDLTNMKFVLGTNYSISITLKDKLASRKSILDTLRYIGRNVKAGDFFLFYFTGHGDTIKDRSLDELQGYDQELIAYDQPIVDDELYRIFMQYFKETENVMIVDACHSGSMYKIARPFIDYGPGKMAVASFEMKSTNKMMRSGSCSLNMQQYLDEPFSLLYLGAAPNDQPALGQLSGGVLTRGIYLINLRAKQSNRWQQYTYPKFTCELKDLIRKSGQDIQYLEIGQVSTVTSNKIPFTH
ncbi:caspase family protein [Flavihumibacter solisilvae]|uniref:Peptidase C14 caspase domain-containing protein n=1 Tax=Flavihumibacter solisilvae TaxID=1349421 RepID=A0A0C1IMR9_9BACT|nr:caspase family protein [Flavihumibacter solisilvae]KIC95500.1 hypothetical protein OI18_06385 [Flavihumibacter solisilvae]